MNKFFVNLRFFDKLNFFIDDYIIVGGGPLAVRKIRDADDIDIIVKESLWNKLVLKHEINNLGVITIGKIEISKTFPKILDFHKLFSRSEVINNHRFMSLKDTLSWKIKRARLKDLSDVALINKYLNDYPNI